MTHTTKTSLAPLNTPFVRVPAAAALALAFARVVIVWDRNRRTRNQLKHLNAHQLEDIGITPRDAQTEARRPFWL